MLQEEGLRVEPQVSTTNSKSPRYRIVYLELAIRVMGDGTRSERRL